MAFHRGFRAHTIEQHKLLALLFDDVPLALIVRRQHAAEHDKICPAAESFRNITRHRTAAIADDLAAEAMRRICTLNHRRQLRVADAGFDSRSADRTGTNADFDDIRARKNQLLDHFTGHHITRADGFAWKTFTHSLQELNKVLGVTIGNIDADEIEL